MDIDLSKKQVVFIVLIGVAILTILSFVNFDFNRSNAEKQTASLLVYFDNTQKRMFEGQIGDGMSILRALYAAGEAGNFDVRYSVNNADEVQLYSIAEKLNSSAGGWQFFLNSTPIETRDIDKVKINVGDLVEVKYQK